MDSFVDYILRVQSTQVHQGATPPCNRSTEPGKHNQGSTSNVGLGRGSSKLIVLPRADRQHLAGQGGCIEKKLKQRREASKSYWDKF